MTFLLRACAGALLLLLVPFWAGEIIRVFSIIMLLANRGAVNVLLRELGFSVHAFASAEEFLASALVGQTCALVLDVALPQMMDRLTDSPIPMPSSLVV